MSGGARRTNNFRAAIPSFLSHGMKSHHILHVARCLGIPISLKTITKSARFWGYKVARRGCWDKTSDRIRWKNRGWKTRCLAIAICYAAWSSYAQAGLGEVDLDAVAKGERPP